MACDSAMKILRYLIIPNYMNKTATDLHIRPSLVIHHINKMLQLELLDVTNHNIHKTTFKKNNKIKVLYKTKPDVIQKIQELIN